MIEKHKRPSCRNPVRWVQINQRRKMKC
jgi:hypothetical protein